MTHSEPLFPFVSPSLWRWSTYNGVSQPPIADPANVWRFSLISDALGDAVTRVMVTAFQAVEWSEVVGIHIVA